LETYSTPLVPFKKKTTAGGWFGGSSTEYWTSQDLENISDLGYGYAPLAPVNPAADGKTRLQIIESNAAIATAYINNTFAWFQPAMNPSKVADPGAGAKAARASIQKMNFLAPDITGSGKQQLFTEYPPKIDLNLDDRTKFKMPTDLYAPVVVAPPTDPESKEPESEKVVKLAVVNKLAVLPKKKLTSTPTAESEPTDKPVNSLSETHPERVGVSSALPSKSGEVGSKDVSDEYIQRDPKEYVPPIPCLSRSNNPSLSYNFPPSILKNGEMNNWSFQYRCQR
jgi:hypothetical protein